MNTRFTFGALAVLLVLIARPATAQAVVRVSSAKPLQEQSVADAKREARLLALTAKGTPLQSKAFKALQAAVEEYEYQRAQMAYAGDGNVREANMDNQAEQVRNDFMAFLEALAAGQIPPADLRDFKQADRLLNANYKKALSQSFGKDYLVDAQRAWIAYRDAAVAFGKVKSPGLGAYAVATWLTRRRAEELR